jgi:hypothetical protein
MGEKLRIMPGSPVPPGLARSRLARSRLARSRLARSRLARSRPARLGPARLSPARPGPAGQADDKTSLCAGAGDSGGPVRRQ